METVEEGPVVHPDRGLQVVTGEGRLELPEIAGQSGRVEAKVVAGAEHRIIAQRRAEDVERIAKLVAGVAGVALGPELGDQSVAAEWAGVLHRQQGEQGDALPQGRPTGYGAVGAIERSAAKQPKCEHQKDLRAKTRARHRHDGSPVV